MQRREALLKTALIMGGAVSIPAITGILQGCTAKREVGWIPQFLSEDQARLVGEVAERILPATDTPGALDAGVDQFIDTILADCAREEDQQRFNAGLEDLEKRSEDTFNNSFVNLENEEKDQLLTELESEAYENEGGEQPFFISMKELTILGYYTSEEGRTTVLNHVPIPARYEGCVPVDESTRFNVGYNFT